MAATMQEQLRGLVELQKVDAELFQLRKELAGIPILQKASEEVFEKKKTAFKSAEESLKSFQLKQKEKESQLQVQEEKIKKLQVQLYQLKSNKEYSTMDLEIKGLKADNSLLEEEILRLLDEVDRAKSCCLKEKELLFVEEKKLKEELEGFQRNASEIQTRAAGLEEKRKSFTPGIDKKLLTQYEKILKNREGFALVPVKNNSCSGCHMELPPQEVHRVMLQEEWVICESCARILYWPA